MPGRIGDDVRRELARFGPAEGMTEIVRAWPDLVGEQIAQNAWPARLARDGTLHVATSSSTWAFELAQLEPQLRGRLGEALAESAPTRLRFAPGKLPDPQSSGGHAGPKRVPDPSPEERERAELMTAEIGNEELRELVRRAVAASLAQAGDDRSV